MSCCVRPWIRALVIVSLGLGAAAALAVHRHFLLVMVDGRSMEPTFHHHDLLLVDRLAYHDVPILRDDIVVARSRGDLLVKRVVALGGEIVAVQQGTVFLDGYPVGGGPHAAGGMDLAPGLVLPGHVALLGDHRSMHPGEHLHAIVRVSDVVGRVLCRLPLQ